MEDLQYYEIAEILNISIGTVMSRPFYGRKKLQSVLEPFCMPYMPLERPRIAGRAYRPNSIYMSGQTFRHGAGTRGRPDLPPDCVRAGPRNSHPTTGSA